MQAGYIVVFWIFPIFSEDCCVKNHHKTHRGLLQNTPHMHYRAVKGEIFMMPCLNSHNDTRWSRTGDGSEGISFGCLEKFTAEAKHSGQYTCGSKWSLNLQVVEKDRCFNSNESHKNLLLNGGENITCPGLNCGDNTDVIWYTVKKKGVKAVSEQRRPCEQNGSLHFCTVYGTDKGLYFCDRHITEQGVKWTMRRSVYVTVRRFVTPTDRPTIMYPQNNTIQEVELGQSLTLGCRIHFPYDKSFLRVQWYVNPHANEQKRTKLPRQNKQEKGSEVTQTAFIEELKLLDNTYTCIAASNVGANSVTITLKEINNVKLPFLVGYPVAPLLLLAALGIVLYVKQLELQLIFRSYFPLGKHNKDKKEFDVFLSYVWSPTSEVEGQSMISSLKADEKALFSAHCEEGDTTHEPLEALLPKVLEQQWGYHLCLFERDVIPGGAYANDIVLAIQRSQMLICLLSADYLSNSSAVFVLESGVKALLQNSTIKLLLIWTNRASASQITMDPPLTKLVQKALRLLPSLEWTSERNGRGSSTFWRSLQKAMPKHRVMMLSLENGNI